MDKRAIAIFIVLALISRPVQLANATSSPPRGSKTYSSEEAQIPRLPSAPPPLTKPRQPETFQCERYLVYRSQTFTCDTNVRQDGERLRSIIQDVPEAVNELNTYQRNRRNIRTAAYIGSLGALILLTGLLITRFYTDQDGNLSPTGNVVRNSLFFGGLTIAAGSFLYGFSLMRINESHLGTAVQFYNEVHPKDTIELKFSTGVGVSF